MTEDTFFAQLFATLPAPPDALTVPPGDDCAAIDLGGGRLLLVAADQVVGNRHYLAGTTSPEAVGRKLLARNLSDIAAMGGVPRYCLTTLALPPERDAAWMLRLLAGITDLAAGFGVYMIGGDIARTASEEVASLTILGEVRRENLRRRGGGQAGDVILATGRFGDSLASGHHLGFSPRIAEGAWLGAQPATSAMIDVSDGLVIDLWRLAAKSGARAVLDTARIPRRTAATTLRQALTDGEDYELLVSARPDKVDYILGQWPFATTELTVVGRLEAGSAEVVDAQGKSLLAGGHCGYDHLERG